MLVTALVLQLSVSQCNFDSGELAFVHPAFPKRAYKKEQLEATYQLDQCTSVSFTCFSLSQCSSITLESFNQLDLATSLSFPKLDSVRFSHQLQANSFDKSSFELRAFRGAASLQIDQDQATPASESFSFKKQQLNRGFVSGGALQKRASTSPLQLTALTCISLSLAQVAWLKPSDKRACRRRTSNPALTLTSLSLAQDAWLKTSSLRAWNRSTLTKELVHSNLHKKSF